MEINQKNLKKVKSNFKKISKKKFDYENAVRTLNPEIDEFCQTAIQIFNDKILDFFVNPEYKEQEKVELIFNFTDDYVALDYLKVKSVDLEGYYFKNVLYHIPFDEFISDITADNSKSVARIFKTFKVGR